MSPIKPKLSKAMCFPNWPRCGSLVGINTVLHEYYIAPNSRLYHHSKNAMNSLLKLIIAENRLVSTTARLQSS